MVVDVRVGVGGQPSRLQPGIASRVQGTRVQIEVSTDLLRPDHSGTTLAVQGNLWPPHVSRDSGQSGQWMPPAVVFGNVHLVALPAVGLPHRPGTGVPCDYDRRVVIITEIVRQLLSICEPLDAGQPLPET